MSLCLSLCLHVSMSPFHHASKSPCLYFHVSMSPSPYLHVIMSLCLHVSKSMSSRFRISAFPQTENGTNGEQEISFVFANGKREQQTSICLLQTEVCRFSICWRRNKQRYPFANGLNGINGLNGLAHLFHSLTCVLFYSHNSLLFKKTSWEFLSSGKIQLKNVHTWPWWK